VLGSPPLEKRDPWSDQVIYSHNQYRALYGAGPVSWNSELYASTLSYAEGCDFSHSIDEGLYGENLYRGTANVGIEGAVKYWMDEASNYDYSYPGFSSTTGHFTQVVWKNTEQVTCALANCPAFYYIVCRYTPPGNVQGQYAENVGRPT
jgi:uncharacterized protein YkwD